MPRMQLNFEESELLTILSRYIAFSYEVAPEKLSLSLVRGQHGVSLSVTIQDMNPKRPPTKDEFPTVWDRLKEEAADNEG